MNTSLVKILTLSALGMSLSWGQSGNYMPTNIASTPTALTAWQVQGEYFGSIEGGGTLGAWVVAKGNNVYDLALLPGGLVSLPGQTGGGWNGTTKYTGSATWNSTTGAYSVTTASGYTTTSISGTGDERALIGTTSDGKAFVLYRRLRKSPTQGMKPKPEWGTATSWFDSATAAAGATGELSKWVAQNTTPQLKYGGYLFRGIRTVATHGAGYLHIEAMVPFMPTATGQNRANSGVYLHSKYELQVLDSFGLTGANNEMGGVYTIKAPLINAALPPMTWQTYDCYFTPRSSGANGAAAGAAYMTVYLNGVLVQDSTPAAVTTEAGLTGSQLSAAGLYLQDHGNEVIFNNIWCIPEATVQNRPWSSIINSVVGVRFPGETSRAGIRDVFNVKKFYDLNGRRASQRTASPVLGGPSRL
jgi:hypothetical protein